MELEALINRRKKALKNVKKFKDNKKLVKSFKKFAKNLKKEIKKFKTSKIIENSNNGYVNEELLHEVNFQKNNTNQYSNYISSEEAIELDKYIEIYLENNFKEHYEVNHYITKNKLWKIFPNIRSLNDHGQYKRIPGILPKFYAEVCKKLEIESAGGSRLEQSIPY